MLVASEREPMKQKVDVVRLAIVLEDLIPRLIRLRGARHCAAKVWVELGAVRPLATCATVDHVQERDKMALPPPPDASRVQDGVCPVIVFLCENLRGDRLLPGNAEEESPDGAEPLTDSAVVGNNLIVHFVALEDGKVSVCVVCWCIQLFRPRQERQIWPPLGPRPLHKVLEEEKQEQLMEVIRPPKVLADVVDDWVDEALCCRGGVHDRVRGDH
mmetsp:Transcript_7710/g.21903  ORF Transcript_7710/g.21903 Transcript_7710/m.21903 type:complete len:215 (+) Transcript_7710:522-1166(+)